MSTDTEEFSAETIEAFARHTLAAHKVFHFGDLPDMVTGEHVRHFLEYLQSSPLPRKIFDSSIRLHAVFQAEFRRDYQGSSSTAAARDAADKLMGSFYKIQFFAWLLDRNVCRISDFAEFKKVSVAWAIKTKEPES